MTFIYITVCDGCHQRVDGWNGSPDGWVSVQSMQPGSIGGGGNYCGSCWMKMQNAVTSTRETA
jgi:hypothetical protein